MSEKITLVSEFIRYNDANELPETDRVLLVAARKSAHDAYAPYSRFHVGAALLLDDGQIILGNNQENASYSLALCAERVALFAAGANFPGVAVKAMAITAFSDEFLIDRPIAPCGSCRQVISEYEHKHKTKIRLILAGVSGSILVADSIEGLLPMQFNADNLHVKNSR